MRYVLPTMPIVFLHYLGKNELSNFHVNNQYWFYFHKLLLFSIQTLNTCMNAHGKQFKHFLLKLSSFVSVSDIILL